MPGYKQFTTLRPGSLDDQEDETRTEMFVDPSPYCSLAGFALHHNTRPARRSRLAEKNPRAHVDFGHAAIARSGGRKNGANPSKAPGPCNDRGAPPVNPSQSRGFWQKERY